MELEKEQAEGCFYRRNFWGNYLKIKKWLTIFRKQGVLARGKGGCLYKRVYQSLRYAGNIANFKESTQHEKFSTSIC